MVGGDGDAGGVGVGVFAVELAGELDCSRPLEEAVGINYCFHKRGVGAGDEEVGCAGC